MSIDITISVLHKEQDGSGNFLGLLKRLCARSVEAQFRLYEIVSGEEEKNYRAINPILNKGDVDRIFGPRKEIRVQMGFVLQSGRTIPITLAYTGKEFGGGGSYQDSGPLSILVPLSDLARPLWELGGVELDNAVSEPSVTAVCVGDAEDLFFAACGVGVEVEPSAQVSHGVMYSDLGFLSMLGCSMVYHRVSSEFLVDYPRIYCAYNFGTNPVSSLIAELELWQLVPVGAEIKHPGRLDPGLYREVCQPDGEQAVSFVNNLDKSRIAHLNQQANSRIREWFRAADLTRWQINFHDLPHDSFAITTYPLFSLWRAYAEFYMDVTGGSSQS
ncbi:hypothetical protein [Tuwongella immobilis]|uniref:Uncharacterized protein n=1 Tax=Tuwongella immobilis TaxID=692036 RepID=A0A6C2YHC8_9BACT|nr:hypothetical protein [Tuwongella immobilis]VIP00764.1 Uncharacterized protein OS=Stanieria cyanosphaera (strain ATCC 29371 / PCC 7437) GN=Sta7437_2625 PE=4 SV=1 [Tuwongella immobilis]VTR96946.1 Uncharacterized protein OS=Stanieria cyanosphaera (strain ATCC 29371 / PCC 7437) GN=Sta7437_2625 PE=4 SV=1 [Tuwongella immobilis]